MPPRNGNGVWKKAGVLGTWAGVTLAFGTVIFGGYASFIELQASQRAVVEELKGIHSDLRTITDTLQAVRLEQTRRGPRIEAMENRLRMPRG